MITYASRLGGFVAAVVLTSAATVFAQEKGTLRVTDLPAGTQVDYAVNGVKPASSTGTASNSGVVDLPVNYTDMSKPMGFKAQVFIDTCPGGVTVHVVESGPTPPARSDCRRRRRGMAEFRPDQVTTFSAGSPSSSLPFGGIGGGIALDTSDMKFTKSLEVWGHRVGSETGEERNNDVPPNFDNEVRMTGSASSFALPLPDVFGPARNRAFWSANDAAAGPGTASRLVAHHAIVSLGRGEAQLDYNNTDTPADSTRWTGSGTLWGVGYGAVVELCDGCRWFANTSYVYSQLQRSTMHRGTALDLDGGRLVRDDASFEWRAHNVNATFGRATEHVFPYAGVRAVSRRASLEGKVDVDYSSLYGFPVEQNVVFSNEFEKTTVQAIFGAQVRIPNTRLFVRAEGSAGGGASGFGVSAGYGWYK
jgi:hypothetical protein